MQFGRRGQRDRPIVVYGVLADAMGTADAGGARRWPGVGSVCPGRPADRDADQPSEASSGTGGSRRAPPPDSPWWRARRFSSPCSMSVIWRSPQPGLPRRAAHRLPQPAAGRVGSEAGGLAGGHRRSWPGPARWPDGPAPLSATGRDTLPGGQTLPARSQTGPSTMSAEAIIREAQLDGFYMLRTSEPADRLPTAAVVRGLNLPLPEDRRPAHPGHRTETRVRAHLFLCLLAYYVHWHLRQALDGEDLEAERARARCWRPNRQTQPNGRRPAPRTGYRSALETLMAHLGTRARHRCRLPSEPESRLASSD